MLMTPSQALAIGSELEEFMRSDAWSASVQVMEEHLTAQIFTSRIDDRDKRENAYLIRMALAELIATFESLTTQAAAIKAEWDLENSLTE